MKVRARSRVLAFVALLAPLFAAPARSANDIERMLELSGIWTQLDQLAPSLVQGIEQAAAADARAADDPRLTVLRRAALAAFEPSELRPRVRRRVEQLFPERALAPTLAFLESPLGRKTTAAENATARLSPEELVRLGAKALGDASDDRKALLRRFDRSAGVTDSALALAIATQNGIVRGLATALPDRGIDADAVEEQLRAGAAGLRAQFEPLIQATIAHSYRELSDVELAAYATFAETDAGRRYHGILLEAVKAALGDRSERLGELIAIELGR